MTEPPKEVPPVSPSARLPVWLPWVGPFALYMILHALVPQDFLAPDLNQALRILIVGGFLWFVSRSVIDLRARMPLQSILMGIGVFVIWIGPDLLFPGYRHSAPFNNDIVGHPESSFPESARSDLLAVILRAIRVTFLIPIVEELFWRGWLPRWAIDTDFRKVPLGTFTPVIFIVTALLFASEHGSWWDVGLIAGIAYNWWMIRTKSLGDCILAHAVTNGCLAVYVVTQGRWEYW